MSIQNDPILDLGLHTTESALALLAKRRHYKVECRKTGKKTNRRECAFFLHADVALPIAGEADRYYPGMTNIKVPYKVAVAYVQDLLRNLEARGARIQIRASEQCIFLG
jgi:hypothetical protein